MIRVLLFGRLCDIAGWRETEITPSPERLSDLRRRLAESWPDLALALGGAGVKVAIDRAVVHGDLPLPAGAEVAFMPPMSGG
jgi:molybdopterin synthase sulfur carrier subunit